MPDAAPKADAPPGELGLVPEAGAAKEGSAADGAASEVKAASADAGAEKAASEGADAGGEKAKSEEAAPGVPAELGSTVAPPEAKKSGKAIDAEAEAAADAAAVGAKPKKKKPLLPELGSAERGTEVDDDEDEGPYVSKQSQDMTWPPNRFEDGLYAPNGVPYPLKKASDLGELNPFTGLHDNPDGTASFTDGTIVEAPNTWVMLDDSVVVQDTENDFTTMAEREAHEKEL